MWDQLDLCPAITYSLNAYVMNFAGEEGRFSGADGDGAISFLETGVPVGQHGGRVVPEGGCRGVSEAVRPGLSQRARHHDWDTCERDGRGWT